MEDAFALGFREDFFFRNIDELSFDEAIPVHLDKEIRQGRREKIPVVHAGQFGERIAQELFASLVEPDEGEVFGILHKDHGRNILDHIIEKFPVLAEVTALTPKMRNISVSNLVATECLASAGFIVGLPESKIETLSMENCMISVAARNLVPVGRSEMYQGLADTDYRGLRLKNVECSMNGVKVENCPGEGFRAEEGCRLSFVRLEGERFPRIGD